MTTSPHMSSRPHMSSGLAPAAQPSIAPRSAEPETHRAPRHAPANRVAARPRPFAQADVRHAAAVCMELPLNEVGRLLDNLAGSLVGQADGFRPDLGQKRGPCRLAPDLFDGHAVVSVMGLVAEDWSVVTAGRPRPWSRSPAAAPARGGGAGDNSLQNSSQKGLRSETHDSLWLGVRLLVRWDGQPAWWSLAEWHGASPSLLATPALGMPLVNVTATEMPWRRADDDPHAVTSTTRSAGAKGASSSSPRSWPGERLMRFAFHRAMLVTAGSAWGGCAPLRGISLEHDHAGWIAASSESLDLMTLSQPLLKRLGLASGLASGVTSGVDAGDARRLGVFQWTPNSASDGAAGRWTLGTPVCIAGPGCTRAWETTA